MIEHGYGAIPSPPDERDVVASVQVLEKVVGATTLPTSYLLRSRPPISDQGLTPQCVAFSTASEQQKNDRHDFGRFVDFDEPTFFHQIGGTFAGAVMRTALLRLRDYGYPEQSRTPDAGKHRIKAFFRIEFNKWAIKRAIIHNKGLLVVGRWWASWEYPTGTKATLPPPSGAVNGHAWWVVGYDSIGVIGQQSWGPQWGNGGLFRMPWYYFLNYMYEVWATTDIETLRRLKAAAR